jgi:hypothetical protein
MLTQRNPSTSDNSLTDNRFPQPGHCGPDIPLRNRRACARADGDTAVIFSVNGSGLFHRGRIVNRGKNGLCFASFCCLPPGTDIRVKTRDARTLCFETGQKWHDARVVWVRQINTDDGCFQTGICFSDRIDP